MKVLLVFVLAIGSAVARGSGPYLPSGWKPDGPAFYLPSEVQKPSDSPLKETLFQETEASGSDALREYGPPKLDESPLQITKQGLPDVITEQSFLDVKTVEDQNAEIVETLTVGVEGNVDQIASIIETVTAVAEPQKAVAEDKTTVLSEGEPTSQAVILDVQPTFESSKLEVEPTIEAGGLEVRPTFEASVLEIEPSFEASNPTVENVQEVQSTVVAIIPEPQPTFEASILEIQPTFKVIALDVEGASVAQTSEAISEPENTEKAELVQEVVPAVVVEEVVNENVAEGAKNIEEALVNLEKEVMGAEVEASEGETAIQVTQEVSGNIEQAPEGFLEYGPPGFREYGPPQEEDLLRSALIQIAVADGVENNEVRKRRFSPKFKWTTPKQHPFTSMTTGTAITRHFQEQYAHPNKSSKKGH